MRKKKQGRPKKKAGLGRDELLQVRITSAEKAIFAEVSELCGQDISVWVRDVLRQAALTKMQENGNSNLFSDSKK